MPASAPLQPSTSRAQAQEQSQAQPQVQAQVQVQAQAQARAYAAAGRGEELPGTGVKLEPGVQARARPHACTAPAALCDAMPCSPSCCSPCNAAKHAAAHEVDARCGTRSILIPPCTPLPEPQPRP